MTGDEGSPAAPGASGLGADLQAAIIAPVALAASASNQNLRGAAAGGAATSENKVEDAGDNGFCFIVLLSWSRLIFK